MKKILIGVLTILISLASGTAAYFYFKDNFTNPIQQNKIIKNEIGKLNKTKKQEELTEEEKVDILKKRFSLRGTIMKGDSFFGNNQMLLALNEYLKAYRESPNDAEIMKKIANVYYDLKRFSQSFEYYEKVEGSLDDAGKEKMMLSLLYSVDLHSKSNIKEASQKIKELDVSKDEKIYYINAINCTLNFHDCKKIFSDYTAGTGVTYQKLLNIKDALANYDNFKSENLYYKDALLIGALFKDRAYNVSNYLGEDMLKNYPGYKPILLTTGKGYYELGEIDKARAYLTQYYDLDQSDVNVTYLLGDINFKLRDYVGSNIYYNNALNNGYTPKLDLQRKLIYNYYLLNDKRGMMKMFSYLLDENDANMNDFSLGIYHAILEGRQEEAMKWAERGLLKFKDKNGYEVFYGYLAWIKREERNFDLAEEYIMKGLGVNPRNPLLTLNYGYLEEFKGNYPKALVYLKRTINVNGEGEFGELAQKEVDVLEKYLQENGQSTTNSGIVNTNSVENN